jgi:hypothetical protein
LQALYDRCNPLPEAHAHRGNAKGAIVLSHHVQQAEILQHRQCLRGESLAQTDAIDGGHPTSESTESISHSA